MGDRPTFNYDGEMRALIARYGQPVTVLGAVNASGEDWLIRFDDGQELIVCPEELLWPDVDQAKRDANARSAIDVVTGKNERRLRGEEG